MQALDVGKSYMVFGRAGLGSSGGLALSSLNGTNGFALNGDGANDQSGCSVASAGDLNRDGIVDLVIGAACTLFCRQELRSLWQNRAG